MRQQLTPCEQWILDNEDRLSAEWEQHLAEMQDSFEHIAYLRNSDRCFQEWCEEQYSEQESV